jgi:hypothetical protein
MALKLRITIWELYRVTCKNAELKIYQDIQKHSYWNLVYCSGRT